MLAEKGRGLRIFGFISLILALVFLALVFLALFFLVLLINLEIRLKAVYLTILLISGKVCFWVGVFLIGRDYYYRNRERIKSWFRRQLE
jgi:hypothetical protein